jgi:hypothetical protein
MTRENHSLVFKTGNLWMEMGIKDVGSGAIPANPQAEGIQKETEFATDGSAVIRNTLFADLLRRFFEETLIIPFQPTVKSLIANPLSTNEISRVTITIG